MRFEESVRWFRKQVTNNTIGRPVVARADFFAPLMSSARTWINDPSLATGGPIADIGVHCIDTLRFVLGDEVTTVSARARYDSQWIVEASAALVLEFSGGTIATVAVSGRSEYQTFLEVIGNEAACSARNALTVDHPVTLERRSGFELREQTHVSNANAYAVQVDEFASAIEQRRDFEIPGEEGLQNQFILDAAFRSVKSGRTEKVC
jgi:predicted dehydrogenase